MLLFFGFLPNEVEALAKKYSFPIDELKEWYDGYIIGDESSIYNPYSVIEAIESGKCSSCWSTTGAYDSVVTYINRNFNGLKDDIIMMLAGGRCRVNTTKFLWCLGRRFNAAKTRLFVQDEWEMNSQFFLA